jgi:hypothetical protein
MVEFILLLPLFLGVLMIILEFGAMVGDLVQIHQACYQGAWTAARGRTVGEIRKAVQQVAPKARDGEIHITYRAPLSGSNGQETGEWGGEVEAGDLPGAVNNIPTGAMIRVSITNYPHVMVTGNTLNILGLLGTMSNYRSGWDVDAGAEGNGGVPVLLIQSSASQPRTN